MRLLRCAIHLLALLASSAPIFAGELRREVFASAALNREMGYVVYVPDGYQSDKRSYPVMLLLHGAGDDEATWVERGKIKENVDRLIESGAIPPTLIVMPGCRGCWWIDGAKDKAETAVWTELLPTVAARYRTIESRDGLVVAGLSAGGYGAVRFALKYPGRVAAVAAMSPAIYRGTPPAISAARLQSPFRGADGKFSQVAWTTYNYPSLEKQYFAQDARVPFYLVSGDGDRLGIAFETARLFKMLFERQPEQVELRIVDGGHDWAVWDNSLADAMKYLYRFVARPHVRRETIQLATPVRGGHR